MMTRLLAWRNPQGKEEEWIGKDKPIDNISKLAGRVISCEIGLLILITTSTLETVAYSVLTLVSLAVYPVTTLPYKLCIKLLESSSFTIVWGVVVAILYNPFLPNIVTHESSARYFAPKINCIPVKFFRSQDHLRLKKKNLKPEPSDLPSAKPPAAVSTADEIVPSVARNDSPEKWQQGQHPKLYEFRGAQYKNGTTHFCVYAPNAKQVSLILFKDKEYRFEMKKNQGGEWERSLPEAKPGDTYQYNIVDARSDSWLRVDPFSFSINQIKDEIRSMIVNSTHYQWGDQAWMHKRAQTPRLQNPLSIYEIQIKSWKSGYSYPLNFIDHARKLIPYCTEMGFTHVECYGLLEHADPGARGYRVANFFAPYRGCGNNDDFKHFVDHLHRNGIGVIIDWIPTHFDHNAAISLHEFDGTDLFAAEASNWGTLYLDYAKEETRRLMFASALYFLDQLHIDAIRFDAVSQMVRRQGKEISSGISFLRELNDTIHSCYPGVMTIAEETEGFPNVTRPTSEGGLGFDVKWDIGWSHNSRYFLQTPYHERHEHRHWYDKIVYFLNSVQHGEKVILTHSHDDTDSGNKQPVLLECVRHLSNQEEKFANLRNFFSWQTCAPSYGYMVHMGDEIAQKDSWYTRLRQNVSCVDWTLTSQKPAHQEIQICIQDFNKLYRNSPQLWEKSGEDYSLIAEHNSNCVVAYHRGTKNNKRLAVVHNFLNKGYPSYDLTLSKDDSNAKKIQKIEVLFNSDRKSYGGSGNFENYTAEIIFDSNMQEHKLRIALPPLSTLVLMEELS
ncbi:MAG: alpha amylase C-terminal domain-containing protein [Verrucomicrobia bacterium]|nr:alpha amylase C-terminal domain-containing protein [Verrucomicrobiota bacterium]